MFFAATLTISVYAAQPTTAPVAPTQDAKDVKALFCSAYTDLGFEPTSWGSTWQTINVQGTSMFYTESIGWDCFTNWGAEEYDLSGYTNFCVDVYAEKAGTITLTFESNQNLDPKVGYTAPFVAGWNKIDLDVKDCYPGVSFKHIKYLVIDKTNIEGSDLAVANAYFYNEGDPTEDPIVANDYYVHVVYAEESETKVLNANTKYLERIKNVTAEGNNSLQLIFREGTESIHAGDTIAIAEKDLQSVEVKKGSEMQK